MTNKINPKNKKYIITFKPKDQRPNQRDDKLEIFRNAIGLTEIRDLLDLTHFTGHHMTTPIQKTNVTVTDINSYDIPIVIAKLDPDQVERIRRDPNVQFVEEDGPKQKYAEIPGYQIEHLRAAPSWFAPLNAQGAGVNVCIIDDGCYSNHPDLAGAVKINQNFSGVGGTTPEGGNFHGTHCAGICGARHNDIGIVGTAPQCNLWNLKVLAGNQVVAAIVEATQFSIQNGAHVLSESYGSRAQWAAEIQAINAAIAAGILIFAAAGNVDLLPDGTCCTPQIQNSYPAGYSGVTGISNSNEDKVLSNSSNYGPQVDFVAPGTNIISCGPQNNYVPLTGTSMACPAVAGIAACMLSAYQDNGCPPYTPGVPKWKIILEVMKDTATKTGFANAGPIGQLDPRFGWGCPQSDKAVASLKGVQVSALVS